MAFTLKQLRYFVAAAGQRSISGAARSVSISQSAVTESIKELESQLGVALFERQARGLEITHEGHRFLRHANAILAEVSSATRSIGSEPRRIAGRLNLGVTPLTAGYVLSEVLSRYRRVNPDVRVSAQEDSGEYLEHLLIGGELDVAVMVTSHLRHRQALHAQILDVSPFRLWLPSGHRLAAQPSISLMDVAQEELIVLDIDEMEDEAVKLLAAFGQRPRITFRTRSVEAVRSLVATGAGVALLPQLVYRPWSLEGARLESRDVFSSLPAVQIGVVWRRGSTLEAAARDFIEVAQEQYRVRSPA